MNQVIKIQSIINELRQGASSREVSLAITKLEEAQHWLASMSVDPHRTLRSEGDWMGNNEQTR